MKIIRNLCRVLTILGMIIVSSLMLLMVVEVISRSFFGKSISGSVEWAQVLLACTMSAFGASVLSNRQIKVDILTTKMNAKNKVILEIVTLSLTFLTVSILSWQQFLYAAKSFNSNVFYLNINLPQWPFVAVFAASYGVAALAIILLIIRKIMSAFKGNWEKEAKLEEMDEAFVFGDAFVKAKKDKEKDLEGGAGK